ncbi:MAG: universal stress protein [Deltaproteobacteria bacterium]|nr:universal stress protein [Deltaproteobacteria bacterium]
MLYVTDLKERISSFDVFKKLLLLEKKVFDRVIFALPSSSDAWTESLSSTEFQFETKTIRNFSYQEITSIAEKERVSCIVVDLDKTSHNTTLRELALKSRTPVLVMGQKHSDKGLFDHVIFATDWSPASVKVMEHILTFRELIAELDIIHVISEKLTVKDMRELKERLEHTRKICLNEGINAESHIYAGDVAEEIVTASEDYRGTMIAIGSGTEKSFLKRIFKRDTVNNIIKSAAVPVLIVPVTVPTSRD